MRRALSCILALCLIFSVTCNVTASEADDIASYTAETAAYVYNQNPVPKVGSIGGEWVIFGLARSGYSVPDRYYRKYYEAVKRYTEDCGGVLSESKYTEYARLVIALTSIGADPSDIAGYDLVKPLSDYEGVTAQGLNGAIWALIALDCGDYAAENSEIRNTYIKYILSRRLADGGWELSGGSAVSDPDMTGMALTALANYRDREDVKSAVDDALAMLSERQNEDGGYLTWGTETPESSVWAMIALNTLGISYDDPRFVKNGNTILDGILGFHFGNGSFRHDMNESSPNELSTEQALYGLCSLKRALEGTNALFDLDDHISTSDGEDTAGFGLDGKIGDVSRVPVQFPAKTFEDIQMHKSQSAIEALAARGIINGKTDDEFDPDATMTRAEFAAIVMRSLGLPSKREAPFDDVSEGDWFYEYISSAYSYGIVNGVSEREFAPSLTITREEAAAMASRAAVLCGMEVPSDQNTIRDTLSAFVDYMTVSDWAKAPMAFCYSNGILDGSETKILPKQAVLRAEIAQMLFNLMGKAELL